MTEVDSTTGRWFCAIACNAPEAAPLRALQDAVRAIHTDAALHWTDPADLHLTLRYYGDVTAAMQPRLTDSLRNLAATTTPSVLDFLRLETWPPIRPRVLVARFRVEPRLVRLQAALEREAHALGFAPEPRRFQPHVTLARAGTGWNGGLARIKLAPLHLEATEIALWHKNLLAPPRHYVETARWALAPSVRAAIPS